MDTRKDITITGDCNTCEHCTKTGKQQCDMFVEDDIKNSLRRCIIDRL